MRSSSEIFSQRCTLVYGVPTMFIAQLNHTEFDSFDFSSPRGGIMAGAPCPVEIMKRVQNEMHCPEITIVYGQTESSPVITGSNADDSVEQRVSTVGCVFPATELKLIDRETGCTVAVGRRRDLHTRLPGDGGLRRGLRCHCRSRRQRGLAAHRRHRQAARGHLTGRAEDVIIRGGENVYPKEVEDFLDTHPAVADGEVLGVPDPKLGEAVLCLDQAEARRFRDRSGDPRILPQ